MKLLTTTFKILSAVSFLLLMIPNEKFNIPMWMGLSAMLIGYGSFTAMIVSLMILTAFVYLFINAFQFTKLNDWISLAAIVIFYIPLCVTIKNIFFRQVLISWLTYIAFIIISILTLALIIRRIMLDNYNDA